ncbi:membrane protein TerC, possibly involved in tellurium resistance [secondary endosymbiont of Heteropsylla cubana]|uniref:Membrane protein TerC, possibly involved in tellurium resistance n=1 Tax=secondary endosymbiont of Heteropsylla cubana TaxID=134287 RepID=J3YTI2_9ENTR|nr:tellurium resistance protein TerC [secondary endosymbiont of Heteropsylla cubana]AFP85768.1 membrane protein TerC, possibly involved in tellurium resistance [secondary endosymbiont of Heteropsylla cubana]
MEFFMDPSLWVGLLTLIILEIILSIDNLIFIAILAGKLPKKKRDKARVLGLSLAIIMRIMLLSLVSWVVTLTQPLLSLGDISFSGRELVLLFGGFFLLLKATSELHEHLDKKQFDRNTECGYASFLAVVIQIVIFDAVFSLDAVITAVGMVNKLPIMITAVIIAMTLMLLASRSLTHFVNSHQTVVVLCLSFLLVIGLSLIAEGFGFYIPKGYLYAAMGFSIIIEIFNQIARRNLIKNQSDKPMCKCYSKAIIQLMSSRVHYETRLDKIMKTLKKESLTKEELQMVIGVLSLESKTLQSLMTPRNEITWLDCQRSIEELRVTVMRTSHNVLPVCNGKLDHLIGVIRAKDLIEKLGDSEQLKAYAIINPAIIVSETSEVVNILKELQNAKNSIIMVCNELSVIQGLITPIDVLEAICNELSY